MAGPTHWYLRAVKRSGIKTLRGSSVVVKVLRYVKADPLESIDFYCAEVLSGHTPVTRVHETTNILAFHHTHPSWPVHIVVVPKRHIASLLALEAGDDALLLELLHCVQQLAAEVVTAEGACRVITNLGAYQDSKHLHWHVVAGRSLKG